MKTPIPALSHGKKAITLIILTTYKNFKMGQNSRSIADLHLIGIMCRNIGLSSEGCCDFNRQTLKLLYVSLREANKKTRIQ